MILMWRDSINHRWKWEVRHKMMVGTAERITDAEWAWHNQTGINQTWVHIWVFKPKWNLSWPLAEASSAPSWILRLTRLGPVQAQELWQRRHRPQWEKITPMQTLLQNYILRILIHLLGDHQSDGSGLITPIYHTLVGGEPIHLWKFFHNSPDVYILSMDKRIMKRERPRACRAEEGE